MFNAPVVSAIVPVTAISIVSPAAANAIALRSEPDPLSNVFVTLIVFASTGVPAKTSSPVRRHRAVMAISDPLMRDKTVIERTNLVNAGTP
jgi:hypothetical protein